MYNMCGYQIYFPMYMYELLYILTTCHCSPSQTEDCRRSDCHENWEVGAQAGMTALASRLHDHRCRQSDVDPHATPFIGGILRYSAVRLFCLTVTAARGPLS